METGNLPYFIGPVIEEYRKLDPDSEEAKRLKEIIAVNITDPTALCIILGVDSSELNFLHPEIGDAEQSTMGTIDSFLDKFGGKTDSIPGAYVIESGTETDNGVEPVSESKESTLEDSDNENAESLKDLIKQGMLEKALEIIEHQNLNNPKKNIYFADQIRFLKKLIILKNYKIKPEG